MTTVGIKVLASLAIEDVKLHEIVRQAVVEDRVLGIEPFAIDDVARAKALPQCWLVSACPSLEKVEVPLAVAAG